MWEEKRERNKEIAKNVLLGYSYHQVGIIYGLTRERVNQIFGTILKKIRVKRYYIKDMRRNKHRLISLIGEL